MIEAIMYFALGFLIAAAIALTTLPAVWNRAVRLTRRRIESLVPVSLAEIQADKDQVRAEYAMAMRRLEISAETLQWKTAEQAVEIGRQAVSVLSMKAELAQKLGNMQAELDRKLGEKDAIIAELDAQGTALRETLAATEQALVATEEKLAATEEALVERTGTLVDAEGRIKDQDQSLGGLKQRLDDTAALAETRQGEIAALTAEVAALRAQLADLERTLAASQAQTQRERDNSEALSRTLAELRGQAEQAGQRLAGLDGRLATQTRENEGLVKRIVALEGELQSRDARLRTLDETVAAVRREAAEARTAAQQAAVEELQREKTALENALAQSREERARLLRELAIVKRQIEGDVTAERAENELLRDHITDVAAEVARLTAQLEGPGSPINALIAEPVRVNGSAPHRDGAPPASALADRIRALQARASHG